MSNESQQRSSQRLSDEGTLDEFGLKDLRRRRLYGLATDIAAALHALGRSNKLKRYALGAASLVFAGGLLASLRALPDQIGPLQTEFIILVAMVGAPLVILLNAFETKLNATLLGVHFDWQKSIEIAIVSSAANMLPLPGGPLVRLTALKTAGAPLLKSGTTMGLIAMIWLGLALLCAGIPLFADNVAIASLFAVLGGLIFSVCAITLYYSCGSVRLLASVIILKSAGILVGLFRMKWALGALAVNASLSLVSIFAVSAVAGSAIAVVPAGLGVNESVAALLAPLKGIEPSVAFVAVSLNRVVTLIVTLAVTLVTLLPLRHRHSA